MKKKTRARTIKQIEVMKAFLEGEEIEWDDGGVWKLTGDPAWSWGNCDYRVKPPDLPKVMYANIYKDGEVEAFNDAYEAEYWAEMVTNGSHPSVDGKPLKVAVPVNIDWGKQK